MIIDLYFFHYVNVDVDVDVDIDIVDDNIYDFNDYNNNITNIVKQLSRQV